MFLFILKKSILAHVHNTHKWWSKYCNDWQQ